MTNRIRHLPTTIITILIIVSVTSVGSAEPTKLVAIDLPPSAHEFYAALARRHNHTVAELLGPAVDVLRKSGYSNHEVSRALTWLHESVTRSKHVADKERSTSADRLIIYVDLTCDVCRSVYERLHAAHELSPTLVPIVLLRPVAARDHAVAYRAATAVEALADRQPTDAIALADALMMTLPSNAAVLDTELAKYKFSELRKQSWSQAAKVITQRLDLLRQAGVGTPAVTYRGRIVSPAHPKSFDDVPFDAAADDTLLRLAIAAINFVDSTQAGGKRQ